VELLQAGSYPIAPPDVGIATAQITGLPKGTNTMEELEAMLAYGLRHGLHSPVVGSSSVHTRRIPYSVLFFVAILKVVRIYLDNHGSHSNLYHESQ
jgi:hypothetical protein